MMTRWPLHFPAVCIFSPAPHPPVSPPGLGETRKKRTSSFRCSRGSAGSADVQSSLFLLRVCLWVFLRLLSWELLLLRTPHALGFQSFPPLSYSPLESPCPTSQLQVPLSYGNTYTTRPPILVDICQAFWAVPHLPWLEVKRKYHIRRPQ